MNSNFLVGLMTVIVGFLLVALFLIGGFFLLGPAFMFVLFAIGAVSSVVAINYDEIVNLGKKVNKYMEERND
ncbi:MAG: hypothetical protein ACRCX2_14525 [Paraclostridium sp.]